VKNEKDEPKEYFERNILLVLSVTAVGLFLDWLAIDLLKNVNPWGSLVAVPGIVISYQAFWLFLNPFVLVYENRFEIKQSLFHDKEFYYLDIKSISKGNSNSITLVYNDNETIEVNLFGIKGSHVDAFYQKLQEKINLSLSNRTF